MEVSRVEEMIDTKIGNIKVITPTIKRMDSLENDGTRCEDFDKDIFPSSHE